MHTHVYTPSLHARVAEHLRGEFSTATLQLIDGQSLHLVTIGDFQESGIEGQAFGADPDARPCTFDPASVVGIELTVLDTRMLGRAEMVEMGLTPGAAA